MAIFNWDNKYKTGITICDEQHKQLIDLINELHDNLSAGNNRDTVGRALQMLVKYVNQHFNTEEELFEKYDYPYATKHKLEHKELTM